MSKTSSKISIARLIEICALKGIRHVVISPGSRNAPLTLSFAEDDRFECLNIPDERVAAFFAMGMAIQSGKPVIICCTSGTAALNYAPAIAEAYYQKIPLIVMTADRPIEWIDQRAGQTMRQRNVYTNYIKKSYELIEEAEQEEHVWYNDRIVNEVINEATNGNHGPVHLNVPMREPLYDLVSKDTHGTPKIIHQTDTVSSLTDQERNNICKELDQHENILVILGQNDVQTEMDELLELLSQRKGIVILSEATSNCRAPSVLKSIDRLIDSIAEGEYERFEPDLIISVGSAIVSKKIRFMLRAMNAKAHWQVDPFDSYMDTYQKLTRLIPIHPLQFFQIVDGATKGRADKNDFQNLWLQREQETVKAHEEFLATCPWSDLKLFNHILNKVPGGSVHLASSTPVRYTQLFPCREDIIYYCNRGVSGIDGCTSTAAGFAYLDDDVATLITGDLAFFYDSNAYWHDQMPPNLKTILINNQGGNIFRYVKGPSRTNHLEKHFEAAHDTSAEGIAQAFGLAYLKIDGEQKLQEALSWLYSTQKAPALLEVITPGHLNIDILKSYFDYLRTVIER